VISIVRWMVDALLHAAIESGGKSPAKRISVRTRK
jgi:hypothetical protein